jgi:peptidoglycan/LPS O-acetylase OafA/YrhL
MLVAAYRASSKIHAWARSPAAAGISIALIIATLAWAPPEYGWRESLLLAFPFAAIALGNTIFGFLESRAVRFMGRISYSFYLLHMVLLTIEIFAVTRYTPFASIGPIGYWLFAARSGAIAIFASAVSYQYLEYPFLHVGRDQRRFEQRLAHQPLRDAFEASIEPAA